MIDYRNKEFCAISCWDDWEKYCDKYFTDETMGKMTYAEIAILQEPDDRIINDVPWFPCFISYRNLDVYYWYSKLAREIFDKLEVDAATANNNNPEWFGKACVYCKIWTKNRNLGICPVCGKELLLHPINEDNDD
jgi:hypothetical protein